MAITPFPDPPQKLIETEASEIVRRGLATQPFLLWLKALDRLYRATGGNPPREVVLGQRTYFVANPPLGNNNNSGLSAVTPFADGQFAINIAAGLDYGGTGSCIIQFADDVNPYPLGLVTKPFIGAGPIFLRGNIPTPANVILQTANAPVLNCAHGGSGVYDIHGFTIRSNGPGQNGIICSGHSKLTYGNLAFGTANQHLQCKNHGEMLAQNIPGVGGSSGATTVLNEAFFIHWYADTHGIITDAGQTVTIIGAPNMQQAWAWCIQQALLVVNADTFVGAVGGAGIKFFQDQIGLIFTGGAGAAYLPGVNPGVATQPFGYA